MYGGRHTVALRPREGYNTPMETMNKRTNIYLTGFMGSGKTTVGRCLSGLLGLPFTDLDALIEEREGMSIPQIFEEGGESAFRSEETEALRAVSGGIAITPNAETDCPDEAFRSVVSCGGGIVLSPANRKILKATGAVVFLTVSPEQVIARLSGDTGRPLIKGRNPEDIRRMMDERLPLYLETADFSVDTEGKSPDEIAREIAGLLSGRRL